MRQTHLKLKLLLLLHKANLRNKKTTDPKSGEDQVTPSKIISSVTGAASVADDVSKQATTSSSEHTESSTDLKKLFDKFDEDGGLDDIYHDARYLAGLADGALKKVC